MKEFTINYRIDGSAIIEAENQEQAEEKFRQLSDKKLIDGLFLEEPTINSIE